MSNVPTIITSVGTIMGVIGAIVTAAVMVQRNSRDSRNEAITGLSTLSSRQQERITSLEKETEDQEVEIRDLRKDRDERNKTSSLVEQENNTNKQFVENVKKSVADLGLLVSSIGWIVPPTRVSILFVGADDKIVDNVKNILNNYGYSTIAVATESEALDTAKQLDSKILGATVVDVLAPGVNPVSLVNSLRNVPNLDKIPVIIIVDFRNESSRVSTIMNTKFPPNVLLIRFPFRQTELIEMIRSGIEEAKK